VENGNKKPEGDFRAEKQELKEKDVKKQQLRWS
jgi:hypothetical protein